MLLLTKCAIVKSYFAVKVLYVELERGWGASAKVVLVDVEALAIKNLGDM